MTQADVKFSSAHLDVIFSPLIHTPEHGYRHIFILFFSLTSQNVCQKLIGASVFCVISCADGRWKGLFLPGRDKRQSVLFLLMVSHWPDLRRKGLAAVCPLTKEMFWRSWCCHENGDTPDWHTESLRPCWCKLSRGYSCASGSNTRPHLEDQTMGSDWQAWRETCPATSLFPSYHRDNHGVLWVYFF